MTENTDKYEKVIGKLRGSSPVLGDPDVFTDKVLRKIREERTSLTLHDMIFEFLFGWVYIGWFRRSMVAAAVGLIIFFGYQQAVILNRINKLSGQVQVSRNILTDRYQLYNYDMVRMIRLSGIGTAEKRINISREEIDNFIESPGNLDEKYRDLIEIIKSDPLLSKYFEEKLRDYKKTKPKI